jgi:hypothetical protein
MPNDATMSDINALTKVMAKIGINHPTVHKAATLTNVEDLSKAMSSINFENGHHIYIPPSTSLDDEPVLLVGTDLDQFTSSSDISTSTSDQQVFRHAAYKIFEGQFQPSTRTSWITRARIWRPQLYRKTPMNSMIWAVESQMYCGLCIRRERQM